MRRAFVTALGGGAAASSLPGASDRIRLEVCEHGDRRLCRCLHAAARRGQTTRAGREDVLDYRYLLDDKSIDAVIIATRQHLHCEHFSVSLDAGKHVYQEKTMACTVYHAKRMCAAMRRAGRRTVQIVLIECRMAVESYRQ